MAALLFSRVVRRLVGRVRPAGLAAIGGALLVAGWTAPALAVTTPTLLAAGAGLGGAWAFLHSTHQPTVLFLGSSAGTTLAAPLADAGEFRTLFAAALAVSVPLVVAAVLARRRYGRTG